METSSSTSELTEATAIDSQVSQEETKQTCKPFLYTNLGKLPFHVYVDAVCGFIELENWIDLQTEFNDAIGTAANSDVSIYAEIEALNIKYAIINSIISLLAIESSDEVWEWAKEELSLMGFDMVGDDLQGLIAKVEVIKLEIAERMEALPNVTEITVPTRQQYVEILARIARHFKLPLRFNEIYTDEFCAHYKAFIEEATKQTVKEEEL